MDGTLIRAWAHRDSFHPKDDPPTRGTGHGGEVLLCDTHESSTDEEARLYKKSAAAPSLPSYLGHVLTENRNGLVVAVCATQSSTTAEREACLAMLEEFPRDGRAITLGADKQYQDPTFVASLRQRDVLPHVAEYEKGRNLCKNSLRAEERASEGFRVSQQKRKLVEKVFGWCKLDRVLRQVKLRGRRKVDWLVRLVMTAQNLRRMVSLIYAQ